jgi:hypothetical protein
MFVCTPGSAAGCTTQASATCPAGTTVVGCTGFFGPSANFPAINACGDGSIGVQQTFFSGNACSVRVFRRDTVCVFPSALTVIAQATCINVP